MNEQITTQKKNKHRHGIRTLRIYVIRPLAYVCGGWKQENSTNKFGE